MNGKKILTTLLLAGLCMSLGAPAMASPALTAQPEISLAQTVTQSGEALWIQYYQAEANKKLVEFQLEPIREQIRLLEGPAALRYYGYGGTGWSEQYTVLAELKTQEYELNLQKEQYEWSKKSAEYQLTLLGEIQKPHELQYQLYLTGGLDLSLESALSLQQEKEGLKLQEELLELEKKNVEYQYKLGQLGEADFLSQYTAVLREKQEIKTQRELLDAQLKLYDGLLGPGALGLGGPGPGGLLGP